MKNFHPAFNNFTPQASLLKAQIKAELIEKQLVDVGGKCCPKMKLTPFQKDKYLKSF